MPARLRALIATWCLMHAGAVTGNETYVIDVKDMSPNRVAANAGPAVAKAGFFYVTGHAEPEIRVEIQIGYHTVDPDFGHCGGRSYGWPKPVSVFRRMVFRPASPSYGVLLPQGYENDDDPISRLCKWQMGHIVVRAYRRTEGDLMGMARFERADRAPYLTDPRPIPDQIVLTCNREAAPPQNWKPRCSYAPEGSVYTHFILGENHSKLEVTQGGAYAVNTPIQVRFRLND